MIEFPQFRDLDKSEQISADVSLTHSPNASVIVSLVHSIHHTYHKHF